MHLQQVVGVPPVTGACGLRCGAGRRDATRGGAVRRLVQRSRRGYSAQAPPAKLVRLAHPTHIRLTADLLQRLDLWRGDRMSRATAIRVLLEQALTR